MPAASTPPLVSVLVAFDTDPFASKLAAVFTMVANNPSYYYVDLTAVDDYVVQDGDVLEYDVYWIAATQYIGVDLTCSDTTTLRGSGDTDQNGLNAAPGTDISTQANGQWYHRQIPLTPRTVIGSSVTPVDFAGKTIQKFDLACDQGNLGSGGPFTAYFRDVVITDGSGAVRKRIWAQVDAPPTGPSLAVDRQAPASGNSLSLSKTLPTPAPNWTDIAQYVRQVDIRRGRQHELDRIEAGTCSLSIDDDDRRFDPTNVSSPYYPNVLPMRRMRVLVTPWGQLQPDGGFESGGLSRWAATGSGTPTVEGASAHDGAYGLRLDAPGGGGAEQVIGTDFIPFSPSLPYTLSAWVKKIIGAPSATLKIIGYDDAGNQVASVFGGAVPAGLSDATAAFVPTSAWARWGATFAANSIDARVTQIKLFFRVSSTTASVIQIAVDSIQLELGAAASAYSDLSAPLKLARFTGYIERWPPSYERRHTEVQVEATDGMLPLGRVDVNKYYPQALSSDRITAVLDDGGWPAELRSIAVGNTTVQVQGVLGGTNTEINVLGHIQDVADAELGIFFMDGFGRAVFLNRLARVQPPYTVSQATIYDQPTVASGLPQYIEIAPSFDADQVYNDVSVTPAAAVTEQIAEDIASERQYGRSTLTRSPIVLTSAEALAQAQYLLGRYKQPSLRFDSITIDPARGPSLYGLLLARELSDRITVQRTPPGGGAAIVRDEHIEAIQESYSSPRGQGVVRWSFALQTSPADVQSYWTLAGSPGDAYSANSVLDQTTKIAY